MSSSTGSHPTSRDTPNITSPSSKRLKSSCPQSSSSHDEGAEDTNGSSNDNNTDTSSQALPRGFSQCLKRLTANNNKNNTNPQSSSSSLSLPSTLTSHGPIKNDMNKLLSLFSRHDFRTSVVHSPRPALSIYIDSCTLPTSSSSSHSDNYDGKDYLLSMIGLHPLQSQMEQCYSSLFQPIHTFHLFCHRLRIACPTAISSCSEVTSTLAAYETSLRDLGDMASSSSSSSLLDTARHLSRSIPSKITNLTTLILNADHRLRLAQLEKEYERICHHNATFSNALYQSFADWHLLEVTSVYFKKSHVGKYERLTIYLYDSMVDELKPPRFSWLPLLEMAVREGVERVVEEMMGVFWRSLLRHGYFATTQLKNDVEPELRKFFLSGLTKDVTLPLLLNAHFDPHYPLSLYLCGKAGAGKSSFVRHFSPALEYAIETIADPAILVRFVKQNLNKHQKDLSLEFELRPNNNDLSIMSIIQGRRMTLTQTKPGLVVVDMEEMPSNVEGSDPNQNKTCQLISQRFGGRRGGFREGEREAPRNSAKRGIAGDASLLTLFTSNYQLESSSKDALKRLPMFQNIKTLDITPVDNDDRIEFAKAYLDQCINDYFIVDDNDKDAVRNAGWTLDIPVGSGDTRPLVRELRMLAFFAGTLAVKNKKTSSGGSIRHDESTGIITVSTKTSSSSSSTNNDDDGDNKQQPDRENITTSIQLIRGSFDNIYPITNGTNTHHPFDHRTQSIMTKLTQSTTLSSDKSSQLSQIIDYYFARALSPTVVVSHDESLLSELVRALLQSSQVLVPSSHPVDASRYKMMKSLYDPNDTPNLRDDLIRLLGSNIRGGGKGGFGDSSNSSRSGNNRSSLPYVAVELKCPTIDSQLCIREMIEDSPSMTAFSTGRSALYKSGLFFAVWIGSDVKLTPEVMSRASIVL